MQVIKDWFSRYLSDPQIIFLILLLFVILMVVQTMGKMLTPVLASLVIAYLLEGLVYQLEDRGVPRLAAVSLVFLTFLLFVTLVLFGVLPLLSRQLTQLVNQLPIMITKGQQALLQLPQRYPEIVSTEQLNTLIDALRSQIATLGQRVVSQSLASVVDVLTLLVYLVLMPMLVFFFMKDKEVIINWFSAYLPDCRSFARQVWSNVDRQIANYVRGKFWEIIIVGAVSFIAFLWFQLNYALLLGVLVGLSVIIPYIGATVVTFPVLLVAWFQWGWTSDFFWLSGIYFVIQVLDGNVLVPLLFSEVVNLHPVAIIVAILVFGGLWGFWGVFFAIPLATVVQAILVGWPASTATKTPCLP